MIHVNFAAVFVASLAHMLIGGLWYSPLLFGRDWMALVGIDKEDFDEGRAMKGYGITFVCGLVQAYVLSWLVYATGAATIMAGLRLGTWVALGIVAVAMAPKYFFSGRPRKLLLIDAGESTLFILIATVIVAVWR